MVLSTVSSSAATTTTYGYREFRGLSNQEGYTHPIFLDGNHVRNRAELLQAREKCQQDQHADLDLVTWTKMVRREKEQHTRSRNNESLYHFGKVKHAT
jgi:hypothetical protein